MLLTVAYSAALEHTVRPSPKQTRCPRPAGATVPSFFFFQAEDGIRDYKVTGVQTCALPIFARLNLLGRAARVLDGADAAHHVGELLRLHRSLLIRAGQRPRRREVLLEQVRDRKSVV